MKSCFPPSSLRFLAVLVALLAPAPAQAQSATDFFDSETLQEVRLFINSRDLGELLEHYLEDRYYPADFAWRGVRVRNAAVRIRGLASRSRKKPGLRVDFNRYVDGQEFLGLNSLVLDNVLKDPALIRERTSMAFIDRMGQPAPRESFGRVYINDEYYGVYTLVEPVDTDFLDRTVGESSGYLFEKKFVTAFLGEYLGDDLNAYKRHFQAQTRELEPDSILYAPIRDLFREVNHDFDNGWREWVNQYIDLTQLVSHVAIETFLAEIDGFLGTAGMANFYLYRPSTHSSHRVFAWDRDTTFQEIDSPIFPRVADNVLLRRALAFDDLRNLYLDVLERCARSAAEGNWLETEVMRADALIRESVYEDTTKPFSNESYDQGIAYLVEFAKRRSAFVLNEIAKARESSLDSR
jgi:spore coat protein CotH